MRRGKEPVGQCAFDGAVGVELARARARRVGLSQPQLAERVGIHLKNTLVKYEKGKSTIPLLLLLRCVSALQVSFADVVGPALRDPQAHISEGLT